MYESSVSRVAGFSVTFTSLVQVNESFWGSICRPGWHMTEHQCLTFCVSQEPEWDVSSAFFANAASHIKPKGSGRKSKENKENEARREVNEC